MNILVATNNNHKVEECKACLSSPNINLFSLKDLSLNSDPEETEKDFLGNAKIKALSAYKEAQTYGFNDYCVLADDSGLCVDALNGEPGIFSARYANTDCVDHNFEDNIDKLLYKLKDVEFKNRDAFFESDIVIVFPDGSLKSTVGRCYGKIAFERHGKNGFGYDPVFLSKDYNYKKTFSEIPQDKKLVISHRGIALKNISKIL